MGTRCLIGRHNKENDTVDFIYCQFDGYPRGVGKTLKSEYWNNIENINKLIRRGDLIALYPDLESSKFSLTPREAVSKGKKNEEFRTKTVTLDDWNNDRFGICGIEFVYLYTDNDWVCRAIVYS